MWFRFLLLGAITLIHSQDDLECCPKRRVGANTYILIESDHDPPLEMGGCLDNCAYRKRGKEPAAADFDQVFCFERGNQSSACLGDTSIEQGISDWSGYVLMENRLVCGDFWDYNAAQVACTELGLGTPKEVFGTARYGVPAKEYTDLIPICVGDEKKLDSCKLSTNSAPCTFPAGLVCSRTTEGNASKLLDGLPICADGFTDTEASAVCKEDGFIDGKTNPSPSQVLDVSTGWSLKCKTANLENCQKSICVNGSLASFTCGNTSEVELFGGAEPGQGTVLFNRGLVCDDSWDIQDANVVCKELGYFGADNATTHSYFGPAETPFQVSQQISIPYTADQVSCTGNETSLSKCNHNVKSDCSLGEAAGVMCAMGEDKKDIKTRKKRGAADVMAAVGPLAETGANIIGSVVEYFEKKEKEKQAYLKERPDQVDLTSAGVEIKLKNEKGYVDLGGEFQAGGMDLKIQNIQSKAPSKSGDGGQSFTYPVGIGPMLMNGCFGTGYKIGDPCYAAKRLNTKCLNMIESANYVGVGFDGTGAYNHAGRRKSLIQRSCAAKSTYQGEDLPDTMNVFGIYDTGCTGKSYETLEARSQSQRAQAKMGENKDFLSYNEGSSFSAEASLGFFSVDASTKYSSHSNKQTQTSEKRRAFGQADAQNSKSITGVFEFSCRIRRYEIFLDEVKPDQLSEAFLQDYMALPVRYFDFRNHAPRKFTDFLSRWGTHYIKSASFGGKFTLLRKSTLSGKETKDEFQARMQDSASSLFESRTSSKEGSGSIGLGGGSVDGQSSGTQDSTSSASSSESSRSNQSSSRSESSMTMDDILVEGGHQRVASILSDKNRAGFKGEFVSWLDSIPQYPKGYDFKFGEIADLLDMNFRSLVSQDFQPCWEIEDQDQVEDHRGNITTYKVTVKDENGDDKEVVRDCHFRDLDDFQEQMERRRLSLKHAVTLFAKNRGRSWNELTIPAGAVDCEKKSFGNDQISYATLLNGDPYEVAFDLLQPIGDRIQMDDSILLRFIKTDKLSDIEPTGNWQVNREQSRAAGQMGKVVTADEMKVYVLGARFTYQSVPAGNYLKWTKFDCQYNVRRFKNLKDIECDFNESKIAEEDNEDGDIDWVGTPLAIVTSLTPPKEYFPCNIEWSNHQMLMSNKSCVRFTAASSGPIYFGLSAVPKKPSTWYYFRITSDDVTVYKGNDLLEASTDANGAVGLGDENLFQSFIICSEYGLTKDDTGIESLSTKLTYGKIAADETMNKNAKLQSYLIVEDDKNEPIEPSFYAFGSGEFEVQIVDIEVTDVPHAECAGDTSKLGSGGCQTTCRIKDITIMSQQEGNNLTCYTKEDKKLEAISRVPAGGYCVVSCEDKPGKVPYPENGKTTCKSDSEWTHTVRCSSKCSSVEVLKKGLLETNGKEVSKPVDVVAKCTDFDGVVVTNFSYVVEGSTCSLGNPDTNLCGSDAAGHLYYISEEYQTLSCTDDGTWQTPESPAPVTQPVCKAIPCKQLSEVDVASSVDIECKINDNDAKLIDGRMNEGASCNVMKCLATHFIQFPSTTRCENGNWTNLLTCSPKNATCVVADIPKVLNGDVDCEGNEKDKATGNYLGGSLCELTCQTGYLKTGAVQCISSSPSQGTAKGIWTKDATCIKDERCDKKKLPQISNGKIECKKSTRRFKPTLSNFDGVVVTVNLPNNLLSRAELVEAGTVCNIKCDSGYEISGQSSSTCTATNWGRTGSCLTQRCFTGSLPTVSFGSVEVSSSTVYRKGDTANIVCDRQYRHDNNFKVATCGDLGRWRQSSKCVRDGIWGQWGYWSTCTKTCQGGTQRRTRSCNNPSPSNGGRSCPGSSYADQRCNTGCCPINAKWGSWGAWSSCSNGPYSCGTGSRKRTRSCTGSSCGGSSWCSLTQKSITGTELTNCYMGRGCCSGGNGCCDGQCGYGEGDCDWGSDCKSDNCGSNNCRRIGVPGGSWDSTDDCCQ